MRGDLSRITKLFQIQLRLTKPLHYFCTTQTFTLDLWFCPKFIVSQYFSQKLFDVD